MKYLIVTNNPKVKNEYDNTLFIDGDYLDVLEKTRDLVYTNVELVTHPLKASARMNFSPYCSIIIGEKLERPELRQLQMIESSIENYKKYNSHRNIDYENAKDYELLDLDLLESSFKDIKYK